jgi:hypothetical protein
MKRAQGFAMLCSLATIGCVLGEDFEFASQVFQSTCDFVHGGTPLPATGGVDFNIDADKVKMQAKVDFDMKLEIPMGEGEEPFRMQVGVTSAVIYDGKTLTYYEKQVHNTDTTKEENSFCSRYELGKSVDEVKACMENKAAAVTKSGDMVMIDPPPAKLEWQVDGQNIIKKFVTTETLQEGPEQGMTTTATCMPTTSWPGPPEDALFEVPEAWGNCEDEDAPNPIVKKSLPMPNAIKECLGVAPPEVPRLAFFAAHMDAKNKQPKVIV